MLVTFEKVKKNLLTFI